MKKRDEFVFKIHGDPSRWHVTVCYALLRSVKVYCDSHVLPRSPKIWCPIVTSVAKFLTVKNFATLVTINTIHSRPLAITTIPVYVLSRLPRFFPIVVIVAIVAQCKPSIIISGVLWHSPDGNFTRNAPILDISLVTTKSTVTGCYLGHCTSHDIILAQKLPCILIYVFIPNNKLSRMILCYMHIYCGFPIIHHHQIILLFNDINTCDLTQCGLVTPYGTIGLGQHWVRLCLVSSSNKSILQWSA